MTTLSKYGRLISLDLFTDAYRVTGRTLVGAGGIHAELADVSSSFLEMQEAYISRTHQPGDIVANYETTAFLKDNINFIVLQDRRDGVPVGTSHGRSVFTRGKPVPAFLTVPSFEIRGEILYDGKATPSAILVQSPGQFQPVFDAQAWASHYPDIQYKGDLILVHKERIGIFCLGSNS